MAIENLTLLDANTDNFSVWLTKTNTLLEHLRNHNLTATGFANNTIGVNDYHTTIGNAYLNGQFAGKQLSVFEQVDGFPEQGGLRGVKFDAVDPELLVPADLEVITNTVFTSTAALVTVTNETLLMGNTVAQSNVTITNTTGDIRIEGTDVDITSNTAQLSTIRTNNSGSLIIDADIGANGATTEIVLRTDNLSAIQISERDVAFFDSLGANSNFVWDSTNERIGIHVPAPTVELDIAGNTHTTDLTVHALANTDNLRVRTNAIVDNNLSTNNITTSNTLVIEHSVTSDLTPTTDTLYALGNTSNRWVDLFVDDVEVTNNSNTNTLHVRSDAVINNNVTIHNNLSTNNVTSSNTFIVEHSVTSAIIPTTDSLYPLGNTSNRWVDLFVDDIEVTNNINTTTIDVGTNATIGNNIDVANTVTITNNLSVGQNSTFGNTATFNAPIILSQQATTTNNPVRADRTITAGTTLTGGGNLSTNVTLNHANIARSDTSANVTLSFGSSVFAIGDITTNAQGHVTGVEDREIKLPNANLSNSANGTHVTITNSAGTNASIPGANTTHAGVITTGPQTFTGDKTFASITADTFSVANNFVVPDTVVFAEATFDNVVVLANTSTEAPAAASVNRFAVFDADPTTSGQVIKSRTPTQVRADISAVATSRTITGGTGIDAIGDLSANRTVNLTNITAGSSTTGALFYNGTIAAAGKLYGGTTLPSAITRLNYDGYLYATRFYGDGSNVTNVNASTAVSLATARTINGTSFNGTANITTANWGTSRSISIGGTAKSVNGSGNVTWATSEIAAQTAVSLATARTINGTSFNGTSDITIPANFANRITSESGHLPFIGITATGNQQLYTNTNLRVNPSTGNISASSFTGDLIGNAQTATQLTNARTINGTSFNGTANITTANWGSARTLTIGSSGKSVNGSGNISWSHAEIDVPTRTGTGASGTWAISITGNAGTVTNGVYTSRTITAGDGLSGGGTLAANRTIAVDSTVIRTTGNQTIGGTKTFSNTISGSITGNAGTVTNGVYTSRSIATGTGLSGGGTLDANRTLSLTEIAAGSTSEGALYYHGTTRTAGRLYGGTTNPTSTTRLNYDGHIYATDMWATSDRNVKKNIESLDNDWCKDVINNLVPRSFQWKEDDREDHGLIAQEVAEYAPLFTGDGTTVNYAKLTTYLIGAVKALSKEIEELKRSNTI